MKAVLGVISASTLGSSKVKVVCASVESYWKDLEGALVEATDRSFRQRKSQARHVNMMIE